MFRERNRRIFLTAAHIGRMPDIAICLETMLAKEGRTFMSRLEGTARAAKHPILSDGQKGTCIMSKAVIPTIGAGAGII